MGRVRNGVEPAYEKVSRNIRNRTKHSILRMLRPSRRRPRGYYDVLGVSVNASVWEVTKAYRKLSLTVHPDRFVGASPAQRTAKTKQFQLLQEAREVLSNAEMRTKYDAQHSFSKPTNSDSTMRVRIHRQYLSAEAKRIVSATEQARQRLKRKRERSSLKRGRHVIQEAVKRGHRLCERSTNANNRYTRGPWIVLRRTKQEQAKDKRRSPFLVVSREEM